MDILEVYDLELSRVVKTIKKKNAKRVLLQLPDGFKASASEIVDFLSSKTDASIFIWFGNCYGGCDIPFIPKSAEFDLIFHFGHSPFYWSEEW
ncbi:MAG: diphthamide synthesis protein [Candidatus Pacearchaeota archaeon]